MTSENYAKLAALTAFSEERDHTINELAHAWLLAHPMVSSVISGATKVEHVKANAASSEWILSTDDVSKVNGIIG
jgi:aryl-alcohol dehydrogenase-like predicted oxidoreductase